MRIGIVCYPTFGGSGVLATELGKALADKGHSVHFITYQQPVRLNEFSANIYYHEVRVPSYPLFDYPPYEIALASTLVDVIANHDLDLLHVHYAIPHASAAYMAKQIFAKSGREIPFITTLHGTDITLVGRDKTYAPVVTFSINESDAITAVSQNLRDETYKWFKITKEIQVINNFVDVKRFNKNPLMPLEKVIAPQEEKILIHASNFRKIKRVGDVVKIFAEVRKKMPAKLLLVGDGPERAYCEDKVRELSVQDDVRFFGKAGTNRRNITDCRYFLLPSEYESFGLAALEAMAAHVPVICSNAGGLPEIIIHGKTGFLADVSDVAAMSAYAIQLLSDDSMLQTFKNNAYEQALQYDIHTIVPLYENMYSKYCRKHCKEE